MPTGFANSYQIVKTCEALKKQGVDVELFAFDTIKPKREEVLDFYGIENDFPIHFFSRITRNHLIYNLRLLFAIIKQKKGRRIVLYARETALVYVLLFAKLFLRTPFVYEAHRFSSRSRYDAWRRKLIIKYASAIIPISKHLKELYQNTGKVSKVAFCGTDPKRFENMPLRYDARRMLGIDENKKIIGYVGSLQEYEGVDLLVAAFSELEQENLELWIVGGKDNEIQSQKSKVKSYVDNIKFVGRVDVDKVPLYLSAFDILVIPLKKQEPGASPVKMFEYLYAGKPIIASDVPAILEILKDGENAVIFRSQDKENLKNAIIKVLDNKELAQKIAQNAKSRALDYSFEKRAEIIKRTLYKIKNP